MKKKILIIVLIIIVIALAVIGYLVYNDKMQEDKLKKELLEINELSNAETIDMDTMNDRLDRIVTTGDYAIVEEAFKSYLRDNFDNIMKIMEILNDEKLFSLLTVQNYKEDGKDFIESKNYIINTKTTLEECKNKYTEFFTEDKAMSYINDKGLDSYYIDFYKNEFMGDMSSESQDTTVQDSIDELIELLNKIEEILNLLSENQNAWNINNDNIVFNNITVLNKYNTLIDSI